MKKAVPVLVALFLIFCIAGYYGIKIVADKYSYSKERVDLNEYYGVDDESRRLILGNEITDEYLRVRDGICYWEIDKVREYLNDVFYVSEDEQMILFTDAVKTYETAFGSEVINEGGQERDLGFVGCFKEGDTLYVALDYVKIFTNFEYSLNPHTVVLKNTWGEKTLSDIAKDTKLRVKGGIKSEIMVDLLKGDEVEVVDKMETWSKVKTSDGYLGYVENKFLDNERVLAETPVTDYAAPVRNDIIMDGKVCLGFNAIGGVGGNDTFFDAASEGTAMNVIAPTWFSINDNEGGFRDFSSPAYVANAHGKGLKVWAVWDDFNYKNENKADVDINEVLKKSSSRRKLEEGIVSKATSLGIDGVNLDFEKITSAGGVHYIQFLRELSILCSEAGLVLSTDNYPPKDFNTYYRLDVQGKVCDYVVIMGYDEHWHGSENPGSVASLNYVSEGITKTAEKMPAGKIINAVPFYTILWKTENTTVTDSYITVENTADFISRMPVSYEWDEECGQNYAEWQSGDAFYQIWIEDANSLSAKLNVMDANDVGGVAVWRLGYGNATVWSLLDVYMQMNN
ncbi:MAG: SH3 domain-containing protein [Lachnospiraceae bacterium]|nr:SH3 domain-containing protein [Lachnospiraceae bacterium]